MKKMLKILLAVVFFNLFLSKNSFSEILTSSSKKTFNYYLDSVPKGYIFFRMGNYDPTTMVFNYSLSLTTEEYIDDEIYLLGLRLKNNKDKYKSLSSAVLAIEFNSKSMMVMGQDIKSFTKTYPSYIIPNHTNIDLISLGIHPKSSKDYKYRVVIDDSVELIPWSPIKSITKQYGLCTKLVHFGNFSYSRKQMLLEVVNTKDYNDREGIVVCWDTEFYPAIDEILYKSKYNWLNLTVTHPFRKYFSNIDSISRLPSKIAFPADSISAFLFRLGNHETVLYRYSLIKNVKEVVDTIQIEMNTDDEFLFENVHFKEPGKYELLIDPARSRKIDTKSTIRFKFEVLPPPLVARNFSFSQVAGYGAGVLGILSLLFLAYFLISKRKLQKSRRQKELTDLKMKSLQAQLNPHFMFNALSSIQNLMNKNETEKANHYLGKFSGLTRKVLESGDSETISLFEEIKLMHDYLQMEQLRFGFNYAIDMGPEIVAENIEVPSMLIQPFIENAVKHGVAGKVGEGFIKINIWRAGSNLIFSLKDNGKGFDLNMIGANSMGIKLVSERIRLLNLTYCDQQIKIKINPGVDGTEIAITLENIL